MPRSIALWSVAVALATLAAVPPRGGAGETAVGKAPSAVIEERLARDLKSLLVCRDGLRGTVTYASSLPDIFPSQKLTEKRLLKREEKEVVWTTWRSHLDYILALDSLHEVHGPQIRMVEGGDCGSFLVAYASFLAQYRFALDFIALVENNPSLDTLLDEAVPEIGIPAGNYTSYKFRFLNVARATEFAILDAAWKRCGEKRFPEVAAVASEDSSAIWSAGRGAGPALTARNAVDLARKGAFKAWYPLQAGVSEWMGDTKVRRIGRSLITGEQIASMRSRLHPGDILLERREWYLSNIGLPGFWPHAALYLGTAEERLPLARDAGVRQWVRSQGRADGDFEALLADRYPAAYALSRTPREEGNVPRVVEAISEGVSFTTLEHSADADSVAVLRPRLSPVEKAAALLRAFHFSGRPYDFNFDFLTDSELVCTELVAKAYEPGADLKGLSFPTEEVMGRKVIPANLIARRFDEEFGTPGQQADLVLFLDGNEAEGNAREASLEEFRKSWKRPKWHILLQEKPAGATGPAP